MEGQGSSFRTVACACGALGLVVAVLVKGLQEHSGHGVDLDGTRESV